MSGDDPERKFEEWSRARPNGFLAGVTWLETLRGLLLLAGGLAVAASVLVGFMGFSLAAGWGKVIVALAILAQAGSILAGLVRLKRAGNIGSMLAGATIVILIFFLTFFACGFGVSFAGGGKKWSGERPSAASPGSASGGSY